MRVTISGEQYVIRKLTPLECWRLMGFDDIDYYHAAHGGELDANILRKINQRTATRDEWCCAWRYVRKQQISSTQLYKQAGNSIVVDVLEAIFRQMI